MKKVLQLFGVFFKIGLFTLGGGSAIIPTVLKEAKDHEWMSHEDFLDASGLINCLPGPISTNIATFVGYQVGRASGALAALLGVISPSIMIVLALSILCENIMGYPVVQYVFNGIRPAVVAIVLHAVVRLGKSAKLGQYFSWVLTAVGFVGIAVLDIHPIILVVAAALYGLILRGHVIKLVDERASKKKLAEGDGSHVA